MPLDLEQMQLSGFEPDLKWERMCETVPPAAGVDVEIYRREALVPILVSIDVHRVLVIEQVCRDIHESFSRVFNAQAKQWTNEEWPSLNQPRSLFGLVRCNGKVYVVGGKNRDDDRMNSIECLDLSAPTRQWVTMDQRLTTGRSDFKSVAIGTQVFILGGYGDAGIKLTSVEILNTETGQLIPGPDIPQYKRFAAAAVNNELLVFARPQRIQGDGDIGEIHTLQPNSTWGTTSFPLPNKILAFEPLVIGDCIALLQDSLYDTKRSHWFSIPTTPFTVDWEWTLVNDTEIIVFNQNDIFSLKLKRCVHPPRDTILRPTKKLYDSLLFSRDFSDVTFVCPDGDEIPAHRNILAGNNPYFQAFFSGRWSEQHPDGRWETEKSSNVIKALLSLIYTGEIPLDVTESTLLDLFDTAYEFQFEDNLLRVCQAKCIGVINESNAKDLLLSAKVHDASFLFEASFEFVCEHFFEIGSDAEFAKDVINVDEQLWQDIVRGAKKASRKRPREESG